MKFCVYHRHEAEGWHIESRGQIEGIGTKPQLSAKDGDGAIMADQPLEQGGRDVRSALDSLASWLRSRYGGARVLGVVASRRRFKWTGWWE